MSPNGGFFSSLFKAARTQSVDVYGKNAGAALFFYLIFAFFCVVVPVAVVIAISVPKMVAIFHS